MLKGLLFDWDGTLCDSLPVCVGAFRMTIQRYTGKELTTEEIMDHFGMNEKGILELKMADRPEIWAEALEDYNVNYRKLHEKVRAPFPGLKDLIADMRKKGVIVGLITGKGEGILDPRGPATRAQAAAILQRFATRWLGM